jgi:hypothetical protein
MEISDVRKRVLETLARARAAVRDRRARHDQGAAEYARFLESVAVPVCRQLANALKAEGFTFTLATPSGAIRLASDRSGDEGVEVTLDVEGERPLVVCRTRRRHGNRVVESERPINEQGAIAAITEEDVLRFLLKELEPFVER